MNKIYIIGNVSNDPETKETKNASVCVFNVAVNNKETAIFYRVNAWRGLGEICQKYVEKGKKVAVIGDLNPRLYESKGKTMMSLDITADEVEFLSAKAKDDFTAINPDDLPF